MNWELPERTYDVVVADPPWMYSGQQDKWGAAAKFYDLIDNETLKTMPVPDLMHKNSILFLWTTSPRLDVAIDLIRHWGLTYRGIAFVWVKTRKDGKTPIGAQGVRPSIVKPTAEYVLTASKQANGRPLKLADESIQNIVLAPKREHSRKPDEVNERIDLMYPGSSKIELFARRQWSDWDTWGNELEKFPAANTEPLTDDSDSG
jgi:N6-adenosine-specific RNA methylase IME4